MLLSTLAFFLPLALALPGQQHHSNPHNDNPDHRGGHHDYGCDYDSPDSHTFHLTNVTYESHIIYSTPAHLAVSYASLAFNLTNPAAYNAECSGTSNGGPSPVYFNYPQLTTCEADAGATGNATFIYLGYSESLQVNETWTCGGNEYFGSGNVTLNLQCVTSSWTNPNWTQGEFYHTEDVTCAPVDVSVVPTITEIK